MFVREVITDSPTDSESCYYCDCGFGHPEEGGAAGVYLSADCACGQCRRYDLPLTKCPDCGEPVTVRR